MPRRKKASPAEDLMDLVAMLPWWVGVMLALVSYLLLHSVASLHVVATAQPGQVGAMVTQTLWKTLASVGQYIWPILCLGGAGMSAWRRRARQSLFTDVAQSKATDALDGMSWREFEMLVGEGFRLQGYQVVKTGGGGGAYGGVELELTKPGKNGGEKIEPRRDLRADDSRGHAAPAPRHRRVARRRHRPDACRGQHFAGASGTHRRGDRADAQAVWARVQLREVRRHPQRRHGIAGQSAMSRFALLAFAVVSRSIHRKFCTVLQ
jgi:hypothetical protein